MERRMWMMWSHRLEAFFSGSSFVPLSGLPTCSPAPRVAADEIAQEACESVFLRWSTIEHPRSYAGAAVVNGARSWARHHRLAERIPPNTDRSIELNDNAIVLRQALRRLTEPEREVVVLRFYADLKVDDIAAEVGASARHGQVVVASNVGQAEQGFS